MEGYLYLKVGRSFVHTYVVLEGQQLQYYDSVDVEKQKFKEYKSKTIPPISPFPPLQNKNKS